MSFEDYYDRYPEPEDDLRSTEEVVEIEIERKTMSIEEIKCPDCDGEMVSRTGKFGVFWGRKNFPKCKGTRDNMGRSKADRAAERDNKQEDEDREIDRAQGRTTFRKGS